MSEPTSTLTFRDLIVEVARHIGIAYYGDEGTAAAQVPVDAHDLDECKRHVNNGIRMFLNDAPQPNGWRWTRPTASVTIWGTIAAEAGKTVTSSGYDPATNKTTLTANQDSFYESMERKTIAVVGVASYTITDYVNATTIKVEGDATAVGTSGTQFSITANGNYTLPRNFSGQFVGDITYTSDTNQGISLEWCNEAKVRQWREDITDETGDPFWAAIRPMAEGSPRRRWEIMLYPKPDDVLVIEFPYHLHFDKLVELDEVHPAPFAHDEAIKAACLAVAEQDVEDVAGLKNSYYRGVCLPNSHRIDAQSAPKKLGYFGNPSARGAGSPIQVFRDHIYQRPNVAYNT